jgi:hypothetical protein
MLAHMPIASMSLVYSILLVSIVLTMNNDCGLRVGVLGRPQVVLFVLGSAFQVVQKEPVAVFNSLPLWLVAEPEKLRLKATLVIFVELPSQRAIDQSPMEMK